MREVMRIHRMLMQLMAVLLMVVFRHCLIRLMVVLLMVIFRNCLIRLMVALLMIVSFIREHLNT